MLKSDQQRPKQKDTIHTKRRKSSFKGVHTVARQASPLPAEKNTYKSPRIARDTLELILQKAPVSIFLMELQEDQFIFVEANEMFLARNKISIEKLRGMVINDLISPGHAAEFIQYAKSAIETQTTEKFTQFVELALGKRWVEIVIEPVTNKQGQIVQLLCITNDITELKDQEAELRKRATRQEALARIGNIALRENTLESFLSEVCEIIAEALGADFTKVQALSSDGQYFDLIAGSGWSNGVVGNYNVDSGRKSQAGYTFLRQQPVICEDIHKEERFEPSALQVENGIRCGVSVLIEAQSGPFGVLSAHYPFTRKFEQSEIEFISTISELIGTAVHHYQAEEALRESENLVSSILSSADIGICVCDSHGRMVRTNQAFSKITGYSVSQLRGRSFAILYPVKRREELRNAFYNYINSDIEKIAFEENIQQKDGRNIEVEIKASRLKPQSDALPEDQHFIFTISDVTKQRQSERNLRLLRLATLHARNGILILDTRIVAPGPEILFVNKAFSDMTGYSAREAVGQGLSFLENENFNFSKKDEIFAALKSKRELFLDIPFQTKTGKMVWADMSLIPVRNEKEEHTNWLMILHDITSRKQTENELIEEKNEAFGASQAKTNFLAEMSHEIRTPLNAIIGFSEFMKNEYLGPIGNEKYLDYAKDIYTCGKHLLDLINSVLDLSKIEAGEMELDYKTFSLTIAMHECIKFVLPQANLKEIEIHFNPTEGVPLLNADQIRVRQVLTNLLSNAIKYTPKGGEVTIEITIDDENSYVEITDTGIGIDKMMIEKALSPYKRCNPEFTSVQESSGLGLPVSKALVEAHGGSLEIKSKKGVGTTVRINFPRERLVYQN